jgi:hypothetical protein
VGLFIGSQNDPFPLLPVGDLALPGTREFSGTFTIKRSRMVNATGEGTVSRLLLFARDSDPSLGDSPMVSLDLDLHLWRDGITLTDGTTISFDDFVFTITLP